MKTVVTDNDFGMVSWRQTFQGACARMVATILARFDSLNSLFLLLPIIPVNIFVVVAGVITLVHPTLRWLPMLWCMGGLASLAVIVICILAAVLTPD